ncbi:MAG: biopolymer transporter ExbD [Deltaproteobacteria bacterium]|nr:biopolymer transporter ExbD [Deltaproteobacteria bacterium]
MGMQVGGGGGKHVAPVMNVTPLVDIVLVLLIIFIVVTPQLTRKFWVHTPKQEKKDVEEQQQDPNPPLVLRIAADRSLSVNSTELTLPELAPRLRRMFAARDDHIIFFDAADGVDYGFAVQVMDQARAGGAVTIAPLIKKLNDAAAAPPAG